MDDLTSSLALSIEQQRAYHSKNTSLSHKENYGQYFTPYNVSRFMAKMFPDPVCDVSLLDPGAGVGSLACAFIQEMLKRNKHTKFYVECFDIDAGVLPELALNLRKLQNGAALEFQIMNLDFIKWATESLLSFDKPRFTHAILNPPYGKINSNSDHRKLLKMVDLELVNLYAAFVSLSLELLKNDGYLVAIIPRSFCNGVYYLPFRKHLLANAVIKKIHLFTSRKSVFKDDNVLQENVILMLKKSDTKDKVIVSYSHDSDFDKGSQCKFDYDVIMNTDSRDLIINIPLLTAKPTSVFDSSFLQLNAKLSTGPVVDFRNKDHILSVSSPNTAPLIYPQHITNFVVKWHNPNLKKPEAILVCNATFKMLYKKGFYVVVKRFSSKEEKRRIVAAIVIPSDFDKEFIAFENHLNVFHNNGSGLDEDFAYGLLSYLNSEGFDQQFRLFSGHTQVNASDLRRMTYPTKECIKLIGAKVKDSDLSSNNFEYCTERYGHGENE